MEKDGAEHHPSILDEPCVCTVVGDPSEHEEAHIDKHHGMSKSEAE